jgi:hypothetical protein
VNENIILGLKIINHASRKGKQLGLNKKVFIDKTKKLEALRYTIEAAQSTAYHPEPVVFMKTREEVFSSITLIVGADVHSGGLGSNAIREQKMIDFIKNTANWGVGFAISALFLSTLIPKMQYWITRMRTGQNSFPGTTDYSQEKKN